MPSLNLLEVLDSKRNEVRRARTADGSTNVAVKLLKPAYDPILPRRFRRSHRMLRRLVEQEQGWAPLLDRGMATDGRDYVVHPYYRAGSAADLLDDGPTPWHSAAIIIARAAQALGRAHRIGWAFGYLRPSNLLLAEPLQPVLSIYGTSTRRFDDGSAEFIAPEVTSVGSSVPASDVYSLTLILASLIIGRGVDHNEPVDDLLAELRGLAPARIVELIDHGLSPNLRNRSADATKMARALAAAIEAPDEVTPDSPAPDDDFDPDAALHALLSEPLIEMSSIEPTAPGVVASSAGIDGVEHATVQPWSILDDDTDPSGDRFPLSDIHASSPESSGPLSDLLNGSGARAEPTVDFSSRRQSGHIDSAQRTRDELEQLLHNLGGDHGAPTDDDDAPDADDVDAGGDVDGDDDEDGAGGSGSRNSSAAAMASTTIDLMPGPTAPVDGDSADLDLDDEGVPFAPRLAIGPVSSAAAGSSAAGLGGLKTRLAVLGDNLAHLIAVNRRWVASASAVVSVSGVTAVAIVLGIGAVRADNVSASEGAPSPMASIEVDDRRTDSGPARADDYLADVAPLAPEVGVGAAVSGDESAGRDRSGSIRLTSSSLSTTSTSTTSTVSTTTSIPEIVAPPTISSPFPLGPTSTSDTVPDTTTSQSITSTPADESSTTRRRGPPKTTTTAATTTSTSSSPTSQSPTDPTEPPPTDPPDTADPGNTVVNPPTAPPDDDGDDGDD